MIKIENLSFSYGRKSVIEDLSLELPDRGVFALMGPSGCGKTTLLYLISGLLKAKNGKIQRESDKIAYSFQEPRLLEQKSALENVKFVLNDKDRDKIALSFLTNLGLEAEANTLPRQLSGGMKQRVSLARALAFDGDVSLFDEPFNGLDEAIKERAAALLRKKGEDSLVILITHSADDAKLCGAQILEFSQLNKA